MVTVLVEDVNGCDVVCFVCVCVEAMTGLCWKTMNSVVFVVKPVHFSELSRGSLYTSTEVILHSQSPPMLSWDGLSAWVLAWTEVLLSGVAAVDFSWALLEVMGVLLGCDVLVDC